MAIIRDLDEYVNLVEPSTRDKLITPRSIVIGMLSIPMGPLIID